MPLIVPAEEVRVVPGKYIEIEDYYSVKDNTSVQETNYTLAHDGETVSEEEGFFAESGVYEYRISAEDGYGNVSEKTISFHVDDVVIEFGDAASVSVAAGASAVAKAARFALARFTHAAIIIPAHMAISPAPIKMAQFIKLPIIGQVRFRD